MKKVLLVFGTRPEAIKMAPLVLAFQKQSNEIEAKICVTAQHREMLDQVLDIFDIVAVEPNISLDTDREKKLGITNESFRLVDIFDGIEEADIIVFLVAHKQFKHLDLSELNCMDYCGLMNKKHK